MESQRQQKIGKIIQKEIADILQRAVKSSEMRGTLISVTQVKVTIDLSQAKVYLSIFPSNNAQELLNGIVSNTPIIKHELAKRTRHQLRKMPNILFFIDDSLDYIQGIETSLKGLDNPIEKPSLLENRKKS